MFHAYAEGNALEPIALKFAIATPALLLQKLSPSSKAHDHATCLQRRMQAWQGHINKLIIEGRTVQCSKDSEQAASIATTSKSHIALHNC